MAKYSTKPPVHNYLTKIRQMWATGALPRTAGLHQVSIFHDNWCQIFQGRRCNCDPDVRLRFSLDGSTN